MIEIKNMNYQYEKGKNVLKNIGLTFNKGEFIGIVGPNGCGKSTLINLLCHVLELQSGSIKINDRNLKDIHQNELARLISVVPQESFFEFDFTALEIVLMGRLPYLSRFQLEGVNDRKLAQSAMEKTKCWEHRDKFIKNLSGGEKQRVIVARALTQNTEIILLDEPTSHLDMNFQYELLDLISDLNKSKKVTVISVFHDINLASKYCSRLIVMKAGKIIADDKPSKVIVPDTLAKIYDFNIILKHHPKEGYKYILPDIGKNESDAHEIGTHHE
jgi:iron complex transport system ATP-binding protein